MKKYAALCLLLCVSFFSLIWADQIYLEDFNDSNIQGKGAIGPGNVVNLEGVTKWGVDVSTAELTSSTDWFMVAGERFSIRDIDEEAIWYTRKIAIAGYSDVAISMDVDCAQGEMDASDYLVVSYVIDGGSMTEIASFSDDFDAQSISVTGLSGDTLQVWVKADNGAGAEYHYFDNVLVTGIPSGGVGAPSNFAATTAGTTQIDLAWTPNSNNNDVVIAFNTTGTFGELVDNTSYPQGSSSPFVGTILYNGNAESVSHTSLNPGTEYYYKIWSKDDSLRYSDGVETSRRTYAEVPTLYINELLAENTSGIVDDNDELEDWFEIYNPTASAIDIGGYYVTDEIGNPAKFMIPADDATNTTVPAGGFLLFWADADTSQGTKHVGFTLSAGGEDLALYHSDAYTPVSQVTFGEQTANVSYGRETDGGSTWATFTMPTANSTNEVSYIVVTAPNGGETLQRGRTHTISWESSPNISNISIRYISETPSRITSLNYIVTDISNTGSWDWAVPTDFELGEYYKIIVENADDFATNDESNAYFSIIEYDDTATTDLIISEYIEGASNNKAIEIFNGTGGTVDLSGYKLKKDSNGSNDFSTEFALSGMLADGDVYVVANVSSVQAIKDVADTLVTSICYFNGDDQVALFKITGATDTELDRIGVPGDVSFGQDVVYVRKATVISPQAGNQDPRSNGEWDSYAEDNFTYLGSHTFTGVTNDPIIEVTSPNGGELWTMGTTQSITWTTENFEGNVKIELVLPAAGRETVVLAESTENDSIFEWTISQAAAAGYKVKISSVDNGAVFDESNLTFTILPLPTTVSTIAELRAGATDGTVYTLTGMALVTFSQDFRGQTYIQDESAAILIDDAGGVINPRYVQGDLIAGITGTISEYRNTMQFVPTANSGSIISSGNPTIATEVALTELESNFEDYESELIVIRNLIFTGTGTFSVDTNYGVVDSSAVSGLFRAHFWSSDYIGTAIPTSTKHITGLAISFADSTGERYIAARSLSDFAEAATDPTLLLTSPNGGEEWMQGGSYEITWVSSNYAGAINVFYGTTSEGPFPLAMAVPDTGFWTWNIPNDFVVGSNYGILISSADNSLTDSSDSTFSIVEYVAPAPGLFISEYAEFDYGNNKALELYNPGDTPVDLSEYAIWRIANGGDWTEGENNGTILSGTIAAMSTYVMVNSSSDSILTSKADALVGSPCYFSGDDAMGLARLIDGTWTLIDVIGTEGADPGVGWDVAGITAATANHTLVRKTTVTQGNTDWAASAGTDSLSSEWVVYPANTCDNLGLFGEDTQLAIPASVTISAVNGQVTIEWGAVENAASYKIWYTTNPHLEFNTTNWLLLDTVNDGTSWTGQDPDNRKFFVITAQ